MKYILTIIVFANITLFGQDEIRKRQFFIGGFASPDISYRLFLNNTGNDAIIANSRDSYEIPKFGYSLGVCALYQINTRIALTIGVEYSNKGQKTKNLDLNFADQIDPRRGNGNPPFVTEQPTKLYFNYNVKYIDIPLRVDIYLSKKKIAPFITTGISTNIYLGEKITSMNTYEDGHTKKQGYASTTLYNAVNPQFQIGAGLDIAMKKSKLRIFPIYRISLTKVHSGSVNQYFYSCGLGLNYMFGF